MKHLLKLGYTICLFLRAVYHPLKTSSLKLQEDFDV
jgi:hypothetical protein